MKWFFIALILLLNGCSGLPKAMRDTSYSNIHLSVVKTDIASYINTPFRWGGTIINVLNEKDSSQIQLLYYPIGRYGRPLTDRKTAGRFAITSPLFLDPAIYKEGTEITVTGILSGEIKQKIGKKTLTLPLLKLEQVHIWPDYQEIDNRYYRYPPFRPYYYPYYRYSPYYDYFY